MLLLCLNLVAAPRDEDGYDEFGYNEDTGVVKDGGTLPSTHKGKFNCEGTCNLEKGGKIIGDGEVLEGGGVKISGEGSSIIKNGVITTGNVEYKNNKYKITDGAYTARNPEGGTYAVVIKQASEIKPTPDGFEGVSTGDPTIIDGTEIKPAGTVFRYKAGKVITIQPKKEIKIEEGISLDDGKITTKSVKTEPVQIKLEGATYLIEGGEGAAFDIEGGKVYTKDTIVSLDKDGKSIYVDPNGKTTIIDNLEDGSVKITATEEGSEIRVNDKEFTSLGEGVVSTNKEKTVAMGRLGYAMNSELFEMEGVVGYPFAGELREGLLVIEDTENGFNIDGGNSFGRFITDQPLVFEGDDILSASSYGSIVGWSLPEHLELANTIEETIHDTLEGDVGRVLSFRAPLEQVALEGAERYRERIFSNSAERLSLIQRLAEIKEPLDHAINGPLKENLALNFLEGESEQYALSLDIRKNKQTLISETGKTAVLSIYPQMYSSKDFAHRIAAGLRPGMEAGVEVGLFKGYPVSGKVIYSHSITNNEKSLTASVGAQNRLGLSEMGVTTPLEKDGWREQTVWLKHRTEDWEFKVGSIPREKNPAFSSILSVRLREALGKRSRLIPDKLSLSFESGQMANLKKAIEHIHENAVEEAKINPNFVPYVLTTGMSPQQISSALYGAIERAVWDVNDPKERVCFIKAEWCF
jgi:hypothetical protein